MKTALYVALFIVLTPSLTVAQSSLGKESLRGLKGVYVIAETISPDAEQRGLTKSQIITDAELRLRKAGIRVPATERESAGDDIGTLAISVSLNERNGLYAYGVTTDLSQIVRLPRMPNKEIVATTYQVAGNVGTVGVNNVRQLRDIINDMVDTLINDYLAMNPKP